MGKRHVDHESTQDVPTHKKRKTGLSYHHYGADGAANGNTTIHTTADTNRCDYPPNQSESADVNTTGASDVTYSLTTDLVDDVVLTDLCAKKWRCGKPIGRLIESFAVFAVDNSMHCSIILSLTQLGKGSFGEIFLASDDISRPATSENAKFVVKIEPHKSGPLFVEIHCLIKAGKPTGKLID